MEIQINAVQDVSRLIGRLRIGDTLEHIDELGLFQRERLVFSEIGKRRELILADTHDSKL